MVLPVGFKAKPFDFVSGLIAEIADGFDGAAFHCFFAGGFFFGTFGLFRNKGMAIFLVHLEIIRGAQNTGIASDTGLVYKDFARCVFFPF